MKPNLSIFTDLPCDDSHIYTCSYRCSYDLFCYFTRTRKINTRKINDLSVRTEGVKIAILDTNKNDEIQIMDQNISIISSRKPNDVSIVGLRYSQNMYIISKNISLELKDIIGVLDFLDEWKMDEDLFCEICLQPFTFSSQKNMTKKQMTNIENIFGPGAKNKNLFDLFLDLKNETQISTKSLIGKLRLLDSDSIWLIKLNDCKKISFNIDENINLNTRAFSYITFPQIDI